MITKVVLHCVSLVNGDLIVHNSIMFNEIAHYTCDFPHTDTPIDNTRQRHMNPPDYFFLVHNKEFWCLNSFIYAMTNHYKNMRLTNFEHVSPEIISACA